MEKSKYHFNEHPFDIADYINSEKISMAWKHIYLSKVKTVYDLLNIQKGSVVLDLGCGTGYASLINNTISKNKIKVISTDISKVECIMGKKHAKGIGRYQEFIVSDASNLPFKDDSFDSAYCIGVLHHILEYRNVLKEMSRISKKFCCVEPNAMNPARRLFQRTEIAKKAGDTRSFHMKDLKNDFISFGLKNIKCKRINCIYPIAEGKALDIMIRMEPIVEKIPVLNLISGSVAVYGEK